jgi:hypothetical protein
VVGDTRPAAPDDTDHYPTEIVRQIWTAVEAETPRPAFAITTGDYMFASTTSPEVDRQLDLYLDARAAYAGVVYPAYGNHECNGDTRSNCGADNADGETLNYRRFMTRMLGPLDEHRPYFAERFAAADGSWSAKLVFIAGNAWDGGQAAWLDRVLAEPTTYTFAIRHEPHYATSAPGTDASQVILARHPLTMLITGHVHSYLHLPDYRELVVGTGGAPLTSGIGYGYVIVGRRSDGTLEVTAYELAGRVAIDHFAITAAGQLASPPP